MFRNYLKVALRNIKRHAGYSLINVVGLAIGMTCCILIMLWVQNELSYDRYHEKADRIFRLCLNANIGGTALHTPITMAPAGPTLVEEFPEVIGAARITRPRRVSVRYRDKIFEEERVGYADDSILEIFSFPLTRGDSQTALAAPYSVVISEDMAGKYFGEEDPMGKTLKLADIDFTVTGVAKNLPRNSHFTFDILRSFQTLYAEDRPGLEFWMDLGFYAYLELAKGADSQKLQQKFPDFVNHHMSAILSGTGGTVEFFLQPLVGIHLYSDFENDFAFTTDITYVYLFSGIALFVLLIACFNFVNLTTASSATRVREVGMRKTLGAGRGKLIGQFLGESVIYSFMSIALACIILELALPMFNSLAQSELSLNYVESPWLIWGFVGLALAVGLLAGSYPAFFLSSFKPVRVLKGGWNTGVSGSGFRRVLVVIQFVISITLIIGTMTIYSQISFIKNKNLGFDKEHVVVIQEMNGALQRSYPSLRDQILSIPGVTAVGASSLVPSRGRELGFFAPEGFSDDQPQTLDYIDIDPGYISTMNLEMAAGRNFSPDLITDSTESVLINEAAARKLGWDNPVGKTFRFPLSPGTEGETDFLTVIGVVKDFHMASLRQRIEPQIMFYDLNNIRFVSVRVAPGNIEQTLSLLRRKWEDINPERPFHYFFLDESLNRLYQSEERLGTISLYFSLLAIFIACLGLFGMSSFTVEQRTKEIGVRKVLGASISGIVFLLSSEFTRWVLVANIIAWPMAYWLVDRWLGGFTYRINPSWTTFVFATILAFTIALATVGYQSIRAARANPVETLRYE